MNKPELIEVTLNEVTLNIALDNNLSTDIVYLFALKDEVVSHYHVKEMSLYEFDGSEIPFHRTIKNNVKNYLKKEINNNSLTELINS